LSVILAETEMLGFAECHTPEMCGGRPDENHICDNFPDVPISAVQSSSDKLVHIT